jgi:flagellin-like hook-associated protein FlgL
MRITQKNLTRAYLSGLNRNINQLAKSNERLSSGKRINRVSDSVTDAQKALKVRNQLLNNEQFTRNIQSIQNEISAQESSAMQMNQILIDVKGLLVKAGSGLNSDSDLTIIANELEEINNSIVQLVNVKTSDRYTFSGLNNEAPISVQNDGTVLFNGVNVDEILDTDLKDDSIFIDVGIGMKFNNDQLDESSVVKLNTSAIQLLGYGKNSQGIPNNLVSMLNKAIKDLKSGDVSQLSNYQNQLKESNDRLLIQVTDIGTRYAYLENTINRLENEKLNLTEQQNHLESIDYEEETIINKSYDMAYQISLQLGSKVLPLSIFDFMR